MTSDVESVVVALGVLVLGLVVLGVRHAWRDWRALRGFNRRLYSRHMRHPEERGRTRAVADGRSWPGPYGQYVGGVGRAVDPGAPSWRDRRRARRRARRPRVPGPPRDDYMPGEFEGPK